MHIVCFGIEARIFKPHKSGTLKVNFLFLRLESLISWFAFLVGTNIIFCVLLGFYGVNLMSSNRKSLLRF